MRYVLITMLLLSVLITPVFAIDLTDPPVPEAARDYMPETDSFSEGLWQILQDMIALVRPDLAEAAGACLGALGAVMAVGMLETMSGMSQKAAGLAGTVAVSVILLGSAKSLIHLGAATVGEISEYGKLLLPVMTTAMAAQGGTVSSAALYTGTAVFDAVLSSLITNLLVPMIYLFLALAVVYSAVDQQILKRIRDGMKWLMTWSLKTVLYIFTGFMGITGVVSGATDAAALKAAKLTISGAVPVVGGILSDASEAVLVSAGLVKNAVGIYGLLATAAVYLSPFVRIGTHYLMLKFTATVCATFGGKKIVGLIEDFTGAMGLLLAMTGAVCLMLMLSTVCFMKGVG